MKEKFCFMLLWGIFALMVGADSRAAAPVGMYTISGQGSYYTTMDASCQAWALTKKNTSDGQGFTFTGVGEMVSSTCRLYKKDSTNYQTHSNFGVVLVQRCVPDGTAPDTTKPLAQQCPEPPVSCADGVEHTQNVTSGWKTGPDWNAPWAKKTIPDGGWNAQRYCRGMCVIVPAGPPTISNQNQNPSPNGYYRVHSDGSFKQTGESCTQTPDNGAPGENTEPTDPPPEKNRCPLGTKQIGTDSAGIPMCKGDAPPTDPKKQTQTTTTTNADGSKTTTKTETTTNSDGSTTTKTTTTTTNANGSDGGSKETTTTSNTPAGKPGKSDGTDQDKSDLCKQNPSLNICKNSQISGTCRSISCDGDAIQCAIARKQAEDSCKRQEDEDAVKASDYYAKGLSAKGGDMTGLPTKDNAEQISINNLDASGWMGGGSCLADKTIQTAAGSFVIPLSEACDVLVMFRYLFMFVASMVSFGILSRSFLGS